ncbi:hypothetical protein [Roseateles amylovorans]|uniref:Transmembrane protein n=1 Tax=Roseateles amylovorans TaxID=2978473 RepID=A0ABY6B3J6_9BURK|nr:hypothetical protein [Roseateles amylovorans]UXH79953.1 hypothetical protein N4261_08770 [Roseateles amylovorans]
MRRAGFLALLALLALPAVRGALETRMSLHMAVELPWLFIVGWMIGSLKTPAFDRLERVDAAGLLGATVASCVLALWMVPAALDLAVLEPGVAVGKCAMWVGAGWVLRRSRQRMPPVVAAFFLVNAAWMMATAGLLYLEAEQALCVNYRVDDQQVTGLALIAWSLVLGGVGLAALGPLLRTPDDPLRIDAEA